MENETEINKSYYAIIPANVRYDDELPANAKLLYGEITALCNEKGYCWASNDYFSRLYNVSKVSISKWISILIDRGYITSEIIYKEGSKQILNRYLRIVTYPIKEKFNTPIKEKLKENNTTINNTSNNKVSKKVSFDELINAYTDNEELRQELKNHLATRKSKKATLTNRAIELSFKKLDELVKKVPINEQEQVKIKIVQQSIERGWTGFFEVKDTGSKQYNNKNTNWFDVIGKEEGIF